MQATLLTLAIAAILALLAALLGPYFIDWNAHRAAFEQHASKAVGLPVRVSGPMEVRLLPSPSLVLSGVEIGQPGDAQTVRAKTLGIEFALPPFLSGKLQAVELRLIGPEMRLSLTEDGRAVLPNALAGVNSQALSIDKLIIEDARLELADAASGAGAALSKLWFNGEVKALPGPIRGEGAFVMDGELYSYRIATSRPEANGSRIKLTINPADRPVYAEAEGLITAPDGAPRFEGTAAIGRRAPVKGDKGDIAEPWKISARVKATAASALFEQVEYQYGPDERALKLHGTAEAKFGDLPRLDAVMSARSLDADKLLAGAGGAGQPPRAAIAALISAAERIIGPPIPTQIGFGIDTMTLGGGSLQNIRGDIELRHGGEILVTAFEARAPGFTQLQASGKIEKNDGRLSFHGPVAASASDPRAFANWLDGQSASSALPSHSMRFRGDLNVAPDTIAIKRLQAEFDRKAFDGDFSYVFANPAEPARLTATLRADNLDLDAWMDLAASFGAVPDSTQPHDVALSLSLKQVRFSGFDGAGAKVKLTHKAGVLAIDALSIEDIAGLGIDGKGRIDMMARRGTISFDVAVRDSDGLGTLAKRSPAALSELLLRAAQAAVPGKLAGSISVEPASDGNSRAAVSLAGPLGAVNLKLQAALTGQWTDPGKTALVLDGSLDAADVNAVLRLAAAERFLSVPKQAGSYTLSAKGNLDGDITIDTRILSADLDIRASGQVRPFADDARRATLDVAVGKASVIVDGAVAKPVPVSLKTQLVSDALGIRLEDVSASVAGTPVRGRIAVALGDTPQIEGEIRTDTIDVAGLAAAASGASRTDKGDHRWSETPFALLPLPHLSGRLSVSAAQATITPAMQVSKFRTALQFADSNLKFENIAGELLGGRLSGDITIQRAPDALGLQAQIAITDADATQLLFGDGVAPLTGQAALTMRLEGMGRSPRALVGSLNGTGTLVLDRARIAALDPKVFEIAMRSVDQGLPIDAGRVRDLASRSLDAGPLIVPHAEATLTIAAGIARIDTFKARAEAADLAVSGSYDFSDSRIDLRVAMSGPAAGASLQPELAVQLRGPAAKPERALDISALTGWLALRSVDRQAKKLEAIEQGRAIEDAPETPHTEFAAPQKPESATASPRRKPPQSALQPLPPAVEFAPAPERRRILPQTQRAEPQRADPRSELPPTGGANPFPRPIGTPPPPNAVRPSPPQSVRPLF
ncbi:MAG: AsmA-like C-terminal region-containing protein [Pseudomonadota bacterium]